MRRLLFLGLFAVSLSPAAVHAGEPGYIGLNDPYCQALDTLHRGFYSDFKDLKGALYDAGHDLKVWSSNVALPGAKRCDIWQTDAGTTLTCEISMADNGVAGKERLLEERNKIEPCLGPGWSVEYGESGETGLRFHANNPVTGAGLLLESKKAGDAGSHSLELTLSKPLAPPAGEKPAEK